MRKERLNSYPIWVDPPTGYSAFAHKRCTAPLPDPIPDDHRARPMADSISHDQSFKNLILDYPREALAFFAPEEAPRPEEPVDILPVRQEQLQEHLGEHYHELDVPLLVEWTDGHREAVLFALQEESDRRRFSIHRLAHYCLDLAELFDTDRVVPVSIFLRSTGRAPAALALGTERRAYLTFDYLACRLRDMPAERWIDSDNMSSSPICQENGYFHHVCFSGRGSNARHGAARTERCGLRQGSTQQAARRRSRATGSSCTQTRWTAAGGTRGSRCRRSSMGRSYP